MPILGRLFSSRNNSTSKTEVVLLITPHVIRNIVRPDSQIEGFTSGTESLIGLDRMEMNSADMSNSEVTKGEKVTELSSTAASALPHTKPVTDIPPIPALGNVKLSLDAPPQIAVGKEFTVKINLAAEGLQNAMLNLSFDPAKLKVISVAEGDLLKKEGGKTQFMQQVQDRAGRVSLSVTRQGNVQGTGMLGSVTFQPLTSATGSTQLRVEAASFSDAKGRVLPINSLPAATIGITQ